MHLSLHFIAAGLYGFRSRAKHVLVTALCTTGRGTQLQ